METSDIDSLWLRAIEEHEKETGVNLKAKTPIFQRVVAHWKGGATETQPEAPPGESREQKTLPDYLIQQCSDFTSARHNKGKMDKARSVLSRLASPLSALLPVAGNIAGAACPAAPVIMVTFTHLIGACARVAEDLDLIESLFEVIHSFVDRLRLLEGKLPPEELYLKQVTNTYCAILKFCTKTHKYIAPPGGSWTSSSKPRLRRLSEWGKSLMREGGDGNLNASYNEVMRCIAALDSATIMKTLASVIELKSDAADTKNQIEKALGGFSGELTVFTGEMKVSMEQRDKKDDKFRREVLEKLRTLDSPGKVGPAERKSQQLDFIKQVLAVDAENLVKQRLKELERSYVEPTFEWIKETAEYKDVMSKNFGVLFISGDSGMGKSALSYFLYKDLLTEFEHETTTSVAYFAFDDEAVIPQSVEHMLYYCASQIATKDESYQDEILEVIRHGSRDTCFFGSNSWVDFFRARFDHENKQRRLLMILDGVDQLPGAERKRLIGLVKDAESKRMAVRFIITGTSESCGGLNAMSIALTQENIRNDIRHVARAAVETSPRLSRLRRRLKARIVQELVKHADSFFYVDHTIRRFNLIGSASVISNALDSLPNNTTDLYDRLLNECLQHQTEPGKVALKRLFGWLAYTKTSLSLGAATRLLTLDSADPGLVIEEEVGGRLSRVLSIFDHYDESDNDTDTDTNDDESYLEGSTTSEKIKSLVGFQERSFRVYFRKALESTTNAALHLSQKAIHVMMFEMSAQILAMPRTGDAYSEAEGELIAYASKSLFEHFISVRGVSAEEAGPVIKGLFAVLTNINGALKKLEAAVPNYMDGPYGILGSTESNIEEALEQLKEFAELDPPASQTSNDNALYQAVQWAKLELGDRATVLKCAARRHIDNWLQTHDNMEAYISFRFAHQALCYLPEEAFADLVVNAGADPPFTRGRSTFESITTSSYYATASFGRWDKTAMFYKRISQALLGGGYGIGALWPAKLGLDLATTREDRFDLLYIISTIKFAMWWDAFNPWFGQFRKLTNRAPSYPLGLDFPESPEGPADGTASESPMFATAIEAAAEILAILEAALELQPEIPHSDHKLRLSINQLYQIKALVETLLEGHREDAIQSMANAMAAKTFDSNVLYFNNILEAFKEYQMWPAIIKLLRQLPGYNPFIYDGHPMTHEAIQKAAKAGTPEDRELVASLYRKAIPSHLEEEEVFDIGCLLYSSEFHWLVMNDSLSAKKLVKRFLEVSRGSLQWVGHASRQLADILTEEFRTSGDLSRKHEILQEMEEVVEITKQRYGAEFQVEQADTRIPLAIMRRKMGPAQVFFNDLNATFNGCLETLQDDKSGNDPYGFRILARTLILVPGMEEYARVALSCQFSIVDIELYEREKGEKEGEKEDDDEDEDEDEDEDKNEDDQAYWRIRCDECSKSISGLEEEKNYLCYYCGWDLCGKCYQARQERQETGAPVDWIEHCALGHGYIEAPVEGWKGIEDGRIKYGDREIPVKDWWTELRGEWERCWEQYWIKDM
ncbi:hypothetical protein FQN54_000782 [Arachnomyces sp. PD_36]|nr:hypothetical protein FQN54_000782 [Arachnomyces sp. PD_36]